MVVDKRTVLNENRFHVRWTAKRGNEIDLIGQLNVNLAWLLGHSRGSASLSLISFPGCLCCPSKTESAVVNIYHISWGQSRVARLHTDRHSHIATQPVSRLSIILHSLTLRGPSNKVKLLPRFWFSPPNDVGLNQFSSSHNLKNIGKNKRLGMPKKYATWLGNFYIKYCFLRSSWF